MLTIHTVLVPTDFSDCSQQAVDYAVQLANTPEATIHLLNVIEPVVYPTDIGIAQVGLADLEQELQNSAEEELAKMKKELEEKGLKVVTAVRHGRASQCTVEYAKTNDIDIISIGTHGRSGFEHFLFGSTTERVLRQAPCPVLVVRQKEQ
jgi:nucleotide-binding universal stress UspA family protein